MQPIPERDRTPRPPSPWTGSRHEVHHSWQLDQVRSLTDAAGVLAEIAAELTAAHAAGWSLQQPMRGGHLIAARPSRRQRVGSPAGGSAGRDADADAPTIPRWRLRLVDEPSVTGDEVLDVAAAARTSVLYAAASGNIEWHSGPSVSATLLADIAAQLDSDVLGDRLWAVAPARIGPAVDLVANGSALMVHAVANGALVRTEEVVSFEHGADRAETLLGAAAAYQRLARALEAMVAAGGRLSAVDDGLLHVSYGVG
ncbi:MAG: hypothetical protein ABIM89_08000 [Mycobacteriales bacterium]